MMKIRDQIVRNKKEKYEVRTVEICVDRECPDGGYGWIICIAAAICQFIIMGTVNTRI